MYKVNAITKQIGPTCGIYAFLNGLRSFYHLEKLSSRKIHKIVHALLQNNKLIHKSEYDKKSCCIYSKIIDTNNSGRGGGKTFIGEFFDIDNYIMFLTNNKEFIIKEIEKVCGEKIDFEVKKISIDCIEEYRDSLFISSISPNDQKPKKKRCNSTENTNVLHWISYISNDNVTSGEKLTFRVMDSRKNKVYLMKKCEIVSQHRQLEGSTFEWNHYFREKRINIKPIDRFVKNRLKYKDEFLADKIIIDIDYPVGEIVMIKKNI